MQPALLGESWLPSTNAHKYVFHGFPAKVAV